MKTNEQRLLGSICMAVLAGAAGWGIQGGHRWADWQARRRQNRHSGWNQNNHVSRWCGTHRLVTHRRGRDGGSYAIQSCRRPWLMGRFRARKPRRAHVWAIPVLQDEVSPAWTLRSPRPGSTADNHFSLTSPRSTSCTSAAREILTNWLPVSRECGTPSRKSAPSTSNRQHSSRENTAEKDDRGGGALIRFLPTRAMSRPGS